MSLYKGQCCQLSPLQITFAPVNDNQCCHFQPKQLHPNSGKTGFLRHPLRYPLPYLSNTRQSTHYRRITNQKQQRPFKMERSTKSVAKSNFVDLDFVVFGAFLVMSVAIGVYHAWNSRRIRKTSVSDSAATEEFLMGSRKMPIAPIALSLLTTFLSGITMLGTPAEIYEKGLLFWVYYMSACGAFLVSGIFFVPIFYKLGATSIYEYFEHRFDSRILRRVAAVVFLTHAVFYMSVVLYAPSIALSGITDYPTWPFILIVGLTCTLYTTIGGLKAVVWTDTLQAVFMYAGVIALVVRGVWVAGGIGAVYDTAVVSGRIEALKRIDINPAQHNSLWISIFGAWSLWMSLYGLNQMALQRYCSLPSMHHVNTVIAVTIPCFIVLGSFACVIGVVMLGSYYWCDPIQTGRAKHRDELVILFATDVLKVLPGLPGLFLATLFSSTLSTISSGMNSMAAVLWEDFLKMYMAHRINDDTAAGLNKVLVLVFGFAATGLAFAAGPLGGIIRASISAMGAISGPLVGLFIFGVFCPRTSKVAAFIALFTGATVTLTICIGGFITKPYKGYFLPTNSTCDAANGTVAKTLPYDGHYGNPDVFYPFRISGYLYPFIGIVIVVTLGTILSYALPEDDDTEQGRARKRSLTYWGRDEEFKRPLNFNRTRTEVAELRSAAMMEPPRGQINTAGKFPDELSFNKRSSWTPDVASYPVAGCKNITFTLDNDESQSSGPAAQGFNPTVNVPPYERTNGGNFLSQRHTRF